VSAVPWRWVLFINVPIGMAVVVLAPRLITEPPRRAARLDLPEVVLSTAGLATLIYGPIRIGAGGSDISVITGLFAAAVVLLSLFIALEVRSRPGWSSRTAGVRHQDAGLTAMTGNSSS
jgi:hypothetical protein